MVGGVGLGAHRAAGLVGLGRLLKARPGDGQRYYELVSHKYGQAMKATPSNVDPRYGFGQTQQQAGRFADSITTYQQTMTWPGMEVLSRYALARCYLDQVG